MNQTLRIASGSIVIGLLVLGLKSWAWWLTGSVALLSDALESVVNVATALAALMAIRVAQRPADTDHPYGHHKAEFFSAVLEGALIIVAALVIMREAWGAFENPRAIEQPGIGLAINAVAGAINAAWCFVLLRQGRRLRSPALVADGKHLATDVVSSFGVILGVGLATATGWLVLDPILAMMVSVNILWSGWKVMTASLSGLMDEAVPQATLADIREIISDSGAGALEAHDLRTRHAGSVTFIDFHLVVPGETTVAAAHDICDRIEASLKTRLPEAQITIHVEPEHKAKHSGVLVI